jgi:hypothetical protein
MRALFVLALTACAATTPRPSPPCASTQGSYLTSPLVRARVFLAQRQRELATRGWGWTAHIADVDNDGQLDCWATYNVRSAINVDAWPSCTGDASHLEYTRHASRLVIPAAVAAPSWLQRIAKELTRADTVACTTKLAAFCISPGPEWRWVLAAQYHIETEHELLGSGELRWQPFGAGIDTVVGALIENERDHIVLSLDPDRERYVEEIQCAGYQIGAYKGGVFARDVEHHRWAWLFRGLPVVGGFTAASLECKAGLVIAHARYHWGDEIRIDPETGAWAYESRDRLPGWGS